MTSQMVVNIDTELKKKAMAMAKKQGLTMKALMGFLLQWYIEKEIEVWAKFHSFERDYWELTIEPLNDEEMKIINWSKELKNAHKKLSKLLESKWI